MTARRRFGGFPAGAQPVPLPDIFFEDAAPQIEDPAELLVTLYALRSLGRAMKYPRLIASASLRGERPLIEALAAMCPDRDADRAFEDGLSAALERGTLLCGGRAGPEGRSVRVIAINSEEGRRAISRETEPLDAAEPAEAGRPPRGAGVYQLYEDAIGPVPPALAAELAEAQADYPEEWLAGAFREAAAANARSWNYVRAILERWQREGRDEAAADGGDSGAAYEHLVQR